MTSHSNVFSHNEESGKWYFSAAKAIIETNVAEKSIRTILRGLKKNHRKSPLHNGNNVKYNYVIDYMPEGRFSLAI